MEQRMIIGAEGTDVPKGTSRFCGVMLHFRVDHETIDGVLQVLITLEPDP